MNKHHMKFDIMIKTPLKLTAVAACLAVLALRPGLAVAAGPMATPNAGSLLRELKPVETGKPSAEAASNENAASPVQGAGPAFMVTQIQFKGQTAIDNATLQAQVADVVGNRLSMASLRALTDRLTAFYRNQGFPFSRVVVPQQDVTQGTLTLEVIEARLGQVIIQNEGRIHTKVLEGLSHPLVPGQPITEAAMDRVLLLMTDTPGSDVRATIKPGQAVGTSDIVIRNQATPMLAGSLGLDSQGNRYTGRMRALGVLKVRNPMGWGDQIDLIGLHAGDGMQYVRAGYDSLVNGHGTNVGGACSTMNYKLSGDLRALLAHGSATTCSAWVTHPLVRSRNWNVQARLQADAYTLRDRVDSTSIRTDRNIDALSASLEGNVLDPWLGGGYNTWGWGVTSGRVKFKDTNAQLSDAVSAHTAGSFSRVNWNLGRMQTLTNRAQLWISLSGQGSSGNLDSSQKLGLGGPNSVRAYDQGTVSGDNGYQGTLELRYLLGNFHGPLQASLFWDAGHVRINHKPWAAATGPNHVTLSGVGLGLNWRVANQCTVAASLAAPTGERPQGLQQARTGVLWISANWVF
jgi:hemolysin activation/secretion protein